MVFEVTPSDAATIHAAAGAFWRPMRTDKNLKRLGADVRRFVDLLRMVASVRIYADVKKAPIVGTPQAEETEVERQGMRLFLGECRKADHAIRRFEHLLVQDVARYFPASAPDLVNLLAQAKSNLNDVRGFIAYVVDERDDEEVGSEFVPPPPLEIGRGGSVEVPGIPVPDCAAPLRLRFSEAAAYQVSEMRARALANPKGVRALMWQGVEFVLSRLQDPGEVIKEHEPTRTLGSITYSSLGKARFLVVGSIEKRQITVLLCSSWASGDEWKAVPLIRERLESSEWDTVFEELNAHVRLTERGLNAMIRVLEGRIAKRDDLSAKESTLLRRLRAAQPFDPVFVEDVREAADRAASAAEDLIDNEDADAAVLEPDRVAWDDVKSEFDA